MSDEKMMPTDVERVAKAIAACHMEHPEYACAWDDSGAVQYFWQLFENDARAAIAALAHPPQARDEAEAWVIRRAYVEPEMTHYFALEADPLGWLWDSNLGNAMTFARKSDAEACLQIITDVSLDDVIVTRMSYRLND